ncbi:hypothetical protein OIU83_00290 [Flavobacterium sp. LS1R49]|uniref:Uncharacterized protein n=1 Tax=Flavobacterium shii TaxID=2987687 RepID=A0A9X2ZAU3_9FLAO|nr:hypothetical protein [Flavobacterium shii]MCV9926077.1 hypothetical protein [Flavobacterium shii]
MSKQFLEGEEIYNLATEDSNNDLGDDIILEDDKEKEPDPKEEIDKGGKTDV